jgi:hypothetical protein
MSFPPPFCSQSYFDQITDWFFPSKETPGHPRAGREDGRLRPSGPLGEMMNFHSRQVGPFLYFRFVFGGAVIFTDQRGVANSKEDFDDFPASILLPFLFFPNNWLIPSIQGNSRPSPRRSRGWPPRRSQWVRRWAFTLGKSSLSWRLTVPQRARAFNGLDRMTAEFQQHWYHCESIRLSFLPHLVTFRLRSVSGKTPTVSSWRPTHTVGTKSGRYQIHEVYFIRTANSGTVVRLFLHYLTGCRLFLLTTMISCISGANLPRSVHRFLLVVLFLFVPAFPKLGSQLRSSWKLLMLLILLPTILSFLLDIFFRRMIRSRNCRWHNWSFRTSWLHQWSNSCQVSYVVDS